MDKIRTGISERRISSLGDNVTEMVIRRSSRCEIAKWDIKTIDLIVLATSTPMIYLDQRHPFKLN